VNAATSPLVGAGRVRAPHRPVEVREADGLPYAEYLRDYVRANRPVVVRNATRAWPALRKWTPQFFKERFGDRMVKVGHGVQMRFDDFIDGVLASTNEKPGPYMYRLFFHQHLPDVLPDLSPPNAYAFPRRHASPLMPEFWRRPDGYWKLLIGGVGGRFPVMHFDTENAHATITEIYGDKEFILYSPSDTPYLYPKPEMPNQSQVDDPHDQDLSRFPLLAEATQYRTLLVPGDTIFVPCGWWHAARAVTTSISVCQNIIDSSNWAGFVDEVSKPGEGRSPARQLAKRAYLTSLGHVLTGVETLQERFPRTAKALTLPARIGPATAEVARDPTTMHLRIRSAP
jgi:hypothetical protein